MAERSETAGTAKVPGYVMVIIVSCFLGAVGEGAKALLDVARLDVRVEQLERDHAALASVPAQLATISADLKNLKDKVDQMASKLDADPPRRPR